MPKENGGIEGTTKTILVQRGKPIPTSTVGLPTRSGFKLSNWNLKPDGTGTEFVFGTTPITAATTLYAQWTINSYTVTFVTEVEGLTIDPIEVNYKGTVTAPNPPSRDGYAFVGWYIDSEMKFLFDFKTQITDNTTLYAKWTINTYTVTFVTGVEGLTVPTQNIANGGKVTKPDPTRPGYTFAGWYKEAQFTNLFDFNEETITASITLYAKWTINTYTVTFVTGVEGLTIDPIEVNYQGTVTAPNPPSRDGYTFAGWYKEAQFTNVFDFNTPITASITLYAKWIGVNRILTIAANGGTAGSTTTINVENGKTATAPSTGLPTRAGYKLSSWNTAANGSGTAFVFGTTTVTANITIYAQWEEIRITSITLDKTTHTTLLGKTTQLTATISPEDVLNKSVTWTSSNAAVATVSGTGLITPVSAGTVDITATSTADNTKSATVAVTVRKYFYVPDANFASKLGKINPQWISTIDGVNGLNIDTVSSFNGTLDVSGRNSGISSKISSLQGIEYFTSLTTLHCNDNSLTTLDVSKNVNLTSFACFNNNLETLDIRGIRSIRDVDGLLLIILNTDNNSLTSIKVHSNVARLSGLKEAKDKISGLQIDTYTAASGSTTYTQAICDFDPNTGLRASTARACKP
ncbi:hypothetical protein CHS0354_000665 [Potamilus streckersoni]|uniref:BIG2 domain-containing protein n=1 Tax=Potamilus streckersoni TaxID=2493646 RepID=A0AAE0T6Z5_9BIVA|nr:hypothetical protein CHS0354_000665 [Potamilus streckersoni]